MGKSKIKVYELKKGIKRVEGIKKQQISEGENLGVLSLAVSILFSDNHLEFSVVINDKDNELNGETDSKWLGFSYFGYLDNLKRCFIKKAETDIEGLFQIIHTNLTTKFSDPYASPLLFIESSPQKAYWPITSSTEPYTNSGFIHLSAVTTFHSLKTHPILSLEGDGYPVIQIVSNINRNKLVPKNPELDMVYSNFLYHLTNLCKEKETSFSCVYHESEKNNPSNDQTLTKLILDEFYDYYYSLEDQGKEKTGVNTSGSSTKLKPFIVNDFLLCTNNVIRSVDFATVSSQGNTKKSRLTQLIYLMKVNIERPNVGQITSTLNNLLATIESCLEATNQKKAIYNPFLLRSLRETPQVGSDLIEGKSRLSTLPSPAPLPNFGDTTRDILSSPDFGKKRKKVGASTPLDYETNWRASLTDPPRSPFTEAKIQQMYVVNSSHNYLNELITPELLRSMSSETCEPVGFSGVGQQKEFGSEEYNQQVYIPKRQKILDERTGDVLANTIANVLFEKFLNEGITMFKKEY